MKIAVVDNPTIVWRPIPKELREYPHIPNIFRNYCRWPAPKDELFSNRFKVIQSWWLWYQSKAAMRLPISPSKKRWFYLAPFLRYGNLLPEKCVFFLPLSHSAPPLPIFPLEFRDEVNHEETRVMGLSCSEDRMIVARVVLTQYQAVTDGRTDGHGICHSYSRALCRASYADAL